MIDFPGYGGAASAMSLLQFTTAIGNAVRMAPGLQGAWVTAELSDVRVSGGHCYMELIEKNDAGQTVAKLRATIWASRFQYVRQKFLAATGREIMTGMKVLLNGTASHHPLYGLSFSVNDIDPSFTLGDMERLRREILMRLQREGIIDRNKSVQMSPAPQRIAVISAEGAAGYGDFINQLSSNPYDFVFYPHLFNAVMQGDKTSASVRSALQYIEKTIDLWDCVVIVRGGGATTDLNGFDDYELAKAVATFPLPVIVGIGHERDRTVLDEIAHTRMKTPTAVAAFLIDQLRASFESVGGMVDWICRYASDRVQGEMMRISNCENMLPSLAETRLTSARALLDREMTRIPVLVSSRLTEAAGKLDSYRRILGTLASGVLSRKEQYLDGIADRLRMSATNVVGNAEMRLKRLGDMVEVLSPRNTLKRGYSITRVDGHAVTDASEIKKGDRIVTQLYDGSIESEVI